MKAACALVFLSGLCACSSTPTARTAASTVVDAKGEIAAIDIAVVDVLADVPTQPDSGIDAVDVSSAADADAAVDLAAPVTVPGDLPAGVTAKVLSSAPWEAASGFAKSPDILLNVPKGTVSMLFVILGKDPGFFSLATAIGPDSVPYGKGSCSALCIPCKNRVGAAPAIGSALLPSSSDVAVLPGVWHIVSCGFEWLLKSSLFAPGPWSGAPPETLVLLKSTLDGKLPPEGWLRLRLFCTGGGGLNAANVLEDPRIAGAIAEIQARYLAVGIHVVVAEVHDVPPGHSVLELPNDVTTTGSSDLDLLFAEVSGGGASIDLFLVDQILGGGVEGKGVVGGVSGSIPGPAFFHGVPRSGIAIALSALGDDPVLIGRTMAHEIGHFLGLWHPTESDGKVFDPISDTPQCKLAQDANKDGVMQATECQGLGADNIMFWLAGNPEALLTKGQGEIGRGNPLVLFKQP